MGIKLYTVAQEGFMNRCVACKLLAGTVYGIMRRVTRNKYVVLEDLTDAQCARALKIVDRGR